MGEDQINNRNLHYGNKSYSPVEKHSIPMIFSNELLLRVHIFESHKCPACKFSTMYDRDLLIHFKTHADKNQDKCDICGIFVQNVKEHRERVHAKCSACKIFFVDLQQLKKHEPECSYLKNKVELHNETAIIQTITNVCRRLRRK